MVKSGTKENPMRQIRVDKVTLNVGAGEGGAKLENAINVLKKILGKNPVKTMTSKRIPDFGVRPGTVIGCKVTLRGADAEAFLNRAFSAVEKTLSARNFDSSGNFSFGIKEHIDLPDVKYDPTLGIIGMDVCVTLKRPGYRVKMRRAKPAKIGKNHLVTKDDAISFAKAKFGIVLREEDETERSER
ncbi:MAG: 50S ribosomal protein L5 [archaeon]